MIQEISTLLHSPWGAPIYEFEAIQSTNTTLLQYGEEGAAHGTLLIANAQTKGRGQFERSWFSPPGKGLWFSLLLREGGEEEASLPLLSQFAAIALTDLFLELQLDPDTISIKEPNDLLLGRKKVAGVLVERRFSSLAHKSFAVVGIGVNLYQQKSDFPPELQEIATSLQMEQSQLKGSRQERYQILEKLLFFLHQRYREFQADGNTLSAIWNYYISHKITI